MNNKQVVLDLETTGLNFMTDKIIGVASKLTEGAEFYYPWQEFAQSTKTLMETNDTKIFHNSKFDLHF